MAAGSLELGEKVASNPVSSYLDADLFRSEMARVIRRRPMPFISSALISQAGDVFSGELDGIPLLAVREESGQAKIYLNSCRHRGAQLVAGPHENKRRELVCPFHGWSYQLNGAVSEIPVRKSCFAANAKIEFRLKEVPSIECSGMLWVVTDGGALELPEYFKQLNHDLPELGLAPTITLPEHSFVGAFNWKLAVEAFLEVYHFSFAHAPYLSQLQYPNLSLADIISENCRIVVPLRRPKSQEPLLTWAQVMYFIFPASFLLFYNDHVALIALTPLSIKSTRVRYIPLVPSKEDLNSQSIRQKVELLKTIIAQDSAILENIQKGLYANANSRFIFTKLESMLTAFHKNLAANLAAEQIQI
jgi:phenylpropionate dioxygenase-like ring-hydroxylating dioxygenase large terminal subunit